MEELLKKVKTRHKILEESPPRLLVVDKEGMSGDEEEEEEEEEVGVLDLSTKKNNINNNINKHEGSGQCLTLNNNNNNNGGGHGEQMYDSDSEGELHIVENDSEEGSMDSSTNLEAVGDVNPSPKFNFPREQEEYLKQLLRNHMRSYPPESHPANNNNKRIANSHNFSREPPGACHNNVGNNYVPQNQKKDLRICANCGTNETTLWRRTEDGKTNCNPCGMYFRFHGRKRPLSLCVSNNKILRRRRRRKDTSSTEDNNFKKSSTASKSSSSPTPSSAKSTLNILPKSNNDEGGKSGEILKTLLIFGSPDQQSSNNHTSNKSAATSSSSIGLQIKSEMPTSSSNSNINVNQPSPSSSSLETSPFLLADVKKFRPNPPASSIEISPSSPSENHNSVKQENHTLKTESQSDQTTIAAAANFVKGSQNEQEFILPNRFKTEVEEK